jgi:hypothetical protein
MTGKELFDYHQSAALKGGFGSPEFRYGNLLFEALKIEGEENIFRKLEEAAVAGKRIGLTYSIAPESETTEPDVVVIV